MWTLQNHQNIIADALQKGEVVRSIITFE